MPPIRGPLYLSLSSQVHEYDFFAYSRLARRAGTVDLDGDFYC